MKIYTLAKSMLLALIPTMALAAGGSFVPTTKSFRHHDYAEATQLKQTTQRATAWRGERINFQILLWGDDQTAKVMATHLEGPGRHKIHAKQVSLDFLKFIKMNTRDAYAKTDADIELVPDMFNGQNPVKVASGKLQPLWVGINIPAKATPGLYKGKILVKMGAKSLTFPYAIDVLNATVPPVKDWTFDVNLWTHPQAAAHYMAGCNCHGNNPATYEHKGCEKILWTDKHLAFYRPVLELLRDGGMRTVLVNLVENPWLSAYRLPREQHQTNYPYDEMIQWRRNKDGKFSFNFTHFERYVSFCMKLGIDRHIECYSMLPWVSAKHSAVTCFDETQNKKILYKFSSWDEYHDVWSQFIDAFVPVLVKHGWFEKTRIGVDERGLHHIPHVLKILDKYKHNGKRLGLSAAVNKTHSFDDQLNVISMHGGTRALANEKFSDDKFASWADGRRAKGLQSTWYTCTGTYPGNFGNSRPAESLFIGWYSSRIKADGYLRWAVDSWNNNPLETTDHKMFETGDTFQVYPGDLDAKRPFARSSVRFELMREGIVDFMKIKTLREKHPESAKALDAMLANIKRPTMPARLSGQSSLNYEKDTENDFSDMIQTAKTELETISRQYAR